jgi:hypothetical protein
MAFLAGIGGRLQRKFRATSSQTHSNSVSDLSQRHTITCQSPCPVTHECSIPTAKAVKRPHPDLVTHDEPPAFARELASCPFSVSEDKANQAMRWQSFHGHPGATTSGPATGVTGGIFLAGLLRGSPTDGLNASRPCEKLAMSRCSYGSFDGKGNGNV